MIEGNVKFIVARNWDSNSGKFDFITEVPDEESSFNILMEQGPYDIALFTGPDGYFAELHYSSSGAILMVPEKVYNDQGFNDLVFNLKEFGLDHLCSEDFGYNIEKYRLV